MYDITFIYHKNICSNKKKILFYLKSEFRCTSLDLYIDSIQKAEPCLIDDKFMWGFKFVNTGRIYAVLESGLKILASLPTH